MILHFLCWQYDILVSVCAQLCPTLCDPMGPKNPGVGCYFLLHGIFLIQVSNLHLLYLLDWRADSLPLCHLGSLRKNTLCSRHYL